MIAAEIQALAGLLQCDPSDVVAVILCFALLLIMTIANALDRRRP